MRTQVGIVGAGPAGLLLSHLLALRGIDSLVVENRSRAYCEARQRAGLLEAGTVELLRTVGLGERMDAEGLEHGGIYLQFEGERHHLDFRDLTGGRWVTIYAQTEIVKDLIRTRLAAGATIEFEVSDTEVGQLDTERPVLRFTDAGGTRHEVVCDAIAGCDGFHGICRDSMPPGLIQVAEREYPYSWLAILALAEVTVLATALSSLLKDGHADLADAYSDTSLTRVWRATHFSWWMTSMLHVDPQSDQFGAELQLAQLRYVISSRAAATTLAENYTGYFPLTWKY